MEQKREILQNKRLFSTQQRHDLQTQGPRIVHTTPNVLIMLVRNSICSNANTNVLYVFRCLLYDFRIISSFIHAHGIFQICMTYFVEHFILSYLILYYFTMKVNGIQCC